MKRLVPLAVILSLALTCLAAKPEDEKLDDQPARTADPAKRKWEITNYLKGTPAEIKATLDKELIDFDAKCKSAEADLRRLDERYQQEEKFVLAEVRKRPDYLAAAAEATKAQGQVDAAKEKPLAERMAASTRLNKLKGEAQRIERAALASNERVASIRKQQGPAKEKIAKMQAGRAKALDWRDGMTDAILNTYELHGPIKPGRSFGVIQDIWLVSVLDDGTVLGVYNLRELRKTGKEGEGFVDVEYDVKAMPIVLRNAPDELKKATPAQSVPLFTSWRVTKIAKDPKLTEGEDALYVEPFETDIDYLIKTILPLPIELPPPPARGKGDAAPPAK
jgi:hypothetical protein